MTPKRLAESARELLHQRKGPLTSELVRTPGGFGLGQVPASRKPDATTTAVCGFCSTGCGLEIHLKDGAAVGLSPARDYSVNFGMACPKGWEALAPLRSKDRATEPLLRNERGVLEPVSWELALETFVDRFKAIQAKHGPASVAWLGTGQIPTEELAMLGSFAKFGMGVVHGDGNTRQCMATAVVAYKESFGFDAPPYTYEDFEQSDVIVLVGSNLCIAHPILWERICRNPHKPEIVVVDPRRTETAMNATLHLAPNPKSDLTLFYAVAQHLISREWLDRDFIAKHTNGFEEFSAHVASYTLQAAAEATGLAPDAIARFAQLVGNGKRVSIWWTMGVNQSHEGVRVAQALINLALLTGNIGRPGTGANSITGQCNAMGSRLFSNTTNLLGGRDFKNAEHRDEVSKILGIPVERIPSEPSLAYDQILEGILRGEIRGLWVVATNTAHSWINQADAIEVLKRLDFLVVQDMYTTTETAALAHLLLPAAGWGEKEGTFINSERRFGLLKKVCAAPGQALADFSIVKLLAEAWGVGDLFRRFTDPEATFQLMKELSRGRPCDITGITDYAMLDDRRGVQWPLREGERVLPQSQRRLFADGRFFHPDEKARFVFESPRPTPEVTSRDYPFVLLTGRGSSSQWHTQTRTAKSPVLRRLYPNDPYVEMSPTDTAKLGISPGEWIIVESQRGKLRARANPTHVVKPGQVFVPMHYAEMNRLTFPAFDPYSRQPSYKHCAVRVRPIEAADT
ncbi:MAG TPA: nitrate reductase [Polyangiaceae bacterium]|nr:nitrate reductase [Polyangiaceae bacterium]